MSQKTDWVDQRVHELEVIRLEQVTENEQLRALYAEEGQYEITNGHCTKPVTVRTFLASLSEEVSSPI